VKINQEMIEKEDKEDLAYLIQIHRQMIAGYSILLIFSRFRISVKTIGVAPTTEQCNVHVMCSNVLSVVCCVHRQFLVYISDHHSN
jgi:hypothetical protein